MSNRLYTIFQSTLPRGERPNETVTYNDVKNISIHAPARGATPVILSGLKHSIIFQSTLPRGERHNFLSVNPLLFWNFNPRSREGSDCFQISTFGTISISIHAPARGATLFRHGLRKQWLLFQSTLPRGERHDPNRLWMFDSSISIHAPARGATTTQIINDHYIINFNPRSREGSDFFQSAHFRNV